jgi:hypothetical protein
MEHLKSTNAVSSASESCGNIGICRDLSAQLNALDDLKLLNNS